MKSGAPYAARKPGPSTGGGGGGGGSGAGAGGGAISRGMISTGGAVLSGGISGDAVMTGGIGPSETDAVINGGFALAQAARARPAARITARGGLALAIRASGP